MGDHLLGYGRQCVDEDDVRAVVEALRSERLTQGPRLAKLEQGLRRATGAAHAVAVSSGTAALHLSNLALDVGPGRRVLTTANTFLASATAAVHCGAEVGFVDVDPATGNMDLDLLEACLGREGPPRAVVAVHFAGLPLDMERLLALRRTFGFRLIEDASHALGARYRVGGAWYRVGEHPDVDAAALSFHPVKHVTTAEGGAVLVGDPALAERIRRLAAHGVDGRSDERPFADSGSRPPWFAPMHELGFNYRLSELHAALGASQLPRLSAFLARRRELAGRYRDALPGLGHPFPGGGDVEHAWHLYVLRVAPERRDDLMAFLRERGIGTQVHYFPVPLQPWFRSRHGAEDFPGAVAHARGCLSIPLYPALSDAEQERVIAALRAWMGA